MRLGLLQLRRARRRTIALTTTVAALTALVLLVSTISATLLGSLAGAVATMRADVLVLTTAAQGTVQASRITPEAVAGIVAVDGVARAEVVGETRITARVDGEAMDASLFGIALAGPGTPATIVAGRAPRHGGEALADDADRRRGFDLGQRVEVSGTDVTLEIVGLTRGGRFGGIATLAAPYATWEAVLGQLFPDASELRPSLVAVEAAPGVEGADLAARITAEVDGVVAREPSVAAMELPGLAGIRDSFRLLGVIAAGSALLLIGSFWSLTTAQQTRTLASLLAAGVASRHLVGALVVQVVVVVGAGVGIASALLWIGGLRAPPTFPLSPDPRQVALIAVGLLIGALAAALPAIRRIAGIDPVVALARAER